MTSQTPAVVLSHGTGGLGAVRALGRRGVKVTAIAYDSTDPVLKSRYAEKCYLVEGTNGEKEAQILQILDDLPAHGAALLTNSDRLVDLMSREQPRLSKKYRFKLPPREILEALNDKKQETKLIESLGFAVPKTVQELPADPEELEQQLRFPIIFKPYLYTAEEHFPKKNEVVSSHEELVNFYHGWRTALPYLLAQEVIPGPDSYSWVASCTFDREHKLLDCGIKQKLRAYPAHFGGSTYAVSRENAEVLELTRSIGQKLNYVGHAGVEFRWDERDKEFKYLEINPRLPANVGFDEACGLSTVWNSYQVSLGNTASDSSATQENGIYFLDLKFDLRSLRTDKTPAHKILLGYLRLFFRRTNGMYFAWDDPKPGLSLATDFFGRGFLQKISTIGTKLSGSTQLAKS